jgi:KaiC/GvpD/RAD55 family RecA-like ATPase
MIKTIKHDRLDTKVPEMTCDHGFNPLLENIPMLKHINNWSFTLIVGRPGSGKTSLLVSWLSSKGKNRILRKSFDNIYLCMPTNSRQSLKNNIFERHSTDKMWNDLTLESISKIYENLEKNVSEKPKKSSLIILDDCGASLKSKNIQEHFRRILYNRRHLSCHIIVLVQSYLSVPKEIRKLATNVIMFKPSKVENENFYTELMPHKRDMIDELSKYIYKKRGDYLLLTVDSGKLYSDYNEIVIDDGEENGYESEEK